MLIRLLTCDKLMQLVLVNPGSEIVRKLEKSKFVEALGEEWMYLTVGEAVNACNFMLHTCKSNINKGVETDGIDVTDSNNIV